MNKVFTVEVWYDYECQEMVGIFDNEMLANEVADYERSGIGIHGEVIVTEEEVFSSFSKWNKHYYDSNE